MPVNCPDKRSLVMESVHLYVGSRLHTLLSMCIDAPLCHVKDVMAGNDDGLVLLGLKI